MTSNPLRRELNRRLTSGTQGQFEALAQILFDDASSQELKDDAWFEITQELAQIQKQQVYKFGIRGGAANELINTVGGDIFLRLDMFQSEDGSFRKFKSWCRTVISHRTVNEQRAAKKHQARPKKSDDGRSPLDVLDSVSHLPRLERANTPIKRLVLLLCLLPGKLPEADEEVVDSWPPLVRLAFLLKSGLVLRTRLDTLNRWESESPYSLAEACSDAQLVKLRDAHEAMSLEEDPHDLEQRGDNDRRAILDRLGAPATRATAAVNKAYRENRYRFYDLPFMGQLIAFPEPGSTFFESLYRHARTTFRTAEPSCERFNPYELGELEKKTLFTMPLMQLCVSGMYPRVPIDIWARWRDQRALDDPFPPANFDPEASDDRKCGQLDRHFQRSKKAKLAHTWRLYRWQLLEWLPSISNLIVWRESTPGIANE